MSATLQIDRPNVDRLLAAMNTVGDQSGSLSAYFSAHVCDTSGFDYPRCALQPLADVLPRLGQAFGRGMDVFGNRWSDVGEAVVASVRHIEKRDELEEYRFQSFRGPDAARGCFARTPQQDEIGDYHIEELSLPEPEQGSQQLEHNGKFDAAADTYDEVRDTINTFLDLIGKVGVHIDKLPEKSLRDFIVYPLSGNYAQIGADANACTALDQAMGNWGQNFARLGRNSPQAIKGATAAGFLAQMTAYDGMARGVGMAIGRGRVVFDAVARMAERIAVEVEDALTVLGEKLFKLSKKIGSKLVPILGWAKLGYDILDKGAGVVQEIIDDVETVRRIIESCFDMTDTIREWAQTQADRLKVFDEVLDTMQNLPVVVGTAPGLSGLSTKVKAVDKRLDGIDVSTPVRSRAEEALNKELDGLVDGDSGADDGGEDEPKPLRDGTIVDPPTQPRDPQTGKPVQYA